MIAMMNLMISHEVSEIYLDMAMLIKGALSRKCPYILGR